jgi:hypothetical protein
MSEVDIWIKLLNRIGFDFIDEICGPGDVNYLDYSFDNKEYRLYFNRNTEKVHSFFDNIGVMNKQKFYQIYIEEFRQIKLNQLL